MSDVARLAQVSTATVSYFLSGREHQMRRVGGDAQDRIRAAVEQLGYVQNKTARHLRRQRAERLCVLLPRLGIPFADAMARQIEAVAHERGFATIVMTADRKQDFARVVHEIEGGLADGLIADVEALDTDELAEILGPVRRLHKACLLIHAGPAPDADYSVITHGRVEALRQALEHCHAAGHRRFAYIHNRTKRPSPRIAAVRDFVAAHPGVTLSLVADGAEDRGRAVARAHEIAALDQRPEMVLLESDFTAVAMIEEFQRLGIDVPTDIAVIGCGNAEEGYYCNPRLTTIGPVEWSISGPTERLIDQIEGVAGDAPSIISVPWTLYVRESG